MRRFSDYCLGFLLMTVLSLGLAWVAGITPDGILYGHWSDPSAADHPSNWCDTSLHPHARNAN